MKITKSHLIRLIKEQTEEKQDSGFLNILRKYTGMKNVVQLKYLSKMIFYIVNTLMISPFNSGKLNRFFSIMDKNFGNSEKTIKENLLLKTKVSDKDWKRMADLIISKKDGENVAKVIKDKNKAIVRFVAGLKLLNKDIFFYNNQYYSGPFSDFGKKALELGATSEEIQDIFDKTDIPEKYSQLINDNPQKGSKGFLTKFILDLGYKIKYLPHNGYALTSEGKDAMRRNGRKWTMGYKTEIDLGNKKVKFAFDDVTDEGNGPSYYIMCRDHNYSDFFDADEWEKLGKMKFLEMLKKWLEKIKNQ